MEAGHTERRNVNKEKNTKGCQGSTVIAVMKGNMGAMQSDVPQVIPKARDWGSWLVETPGHLAGGYITAIFLP